MQQHLEDQSTEIAKLKKQLQKAYEDMNELRNLYEEEMKLLLNGGIYDLLITVNVLMQSLK